MLIDDIIEQLCSKLSSKDEPITRRSVNRIIQNAIDDLGLIEYDRDAVIYAYGIVYKIITARQVPTEFKEQTGSVSRLIKQIMLEKDDTKQEQIQVPKKSVKETKSVQRQTKRKQKYLDIKILPDNFYIKLQNQINDAYHCKVYSAVTILIRKFLENLIVDILRKKYGDKPPGLELYFNIHNNRYHDFSFLLEKLEEKVKLEDFKSLPALNKSFIDKINVYRNKGNLSVHTLEIDFTKEDIDIDKSKIQLILEVLIRVFNLC